MSTPSTDAQRWADGGGMWLTGPADGPGLGPPEPLLPLLDALCARIAGASAQMGRRVDIDPMVTVTERAAWAGLGRWGRRSCGGVSRLLRAADGWAAITLARPSDLDSVPALLEGPVGDDPWPAIEAWCARTTMAAIADRAELLALPIGALGERTPAEALACTDLGTASVGRPRVIDLSAMWAGPLCGAILTAAGCDVTKVESATRPDGARLGPKGFFRRLHDGKRMLTIPFEEADGRSRLAELLATADVVIEASRPRALLQLGVDRLAMQVNGPAVWATITGHGAGHNRVGFGDDAAVAGGLVVWDGDEPFFAADAIADPITGLFAAAEVMEAVIAGRRAHLDIAMAGVAALAAGPTVAVPLGVVAAPPRV